jgi:hypothetical protein
MSQAQQTSVRPGRSKLQLRAKSKDETERTKSDIRRDVHIEGSSEKYEFVHHKDGPSSKQNKSIKTKKLQENKFHAQRKGRPKKYKFACRKTKSSGGARRMIEASASRLHAQTTN